MYLSEAIISSEELDGMPVTEVEEVLRLQGGVTVDLMVESICEVVERVKYLIWLMGYLCQMFTAVGLVFK